MTGVHALRAVSISLHGIIHPEQEEWRSELCRQLDDDGGVNRVLVLCDRALAAPSADCRDACFETLLMGTVGARRQFDKCVERDLTSMLALVLGSNSAMKSSQPSKDSQTDSSP